MKSDTSKLKQSVPFTKELCAMCKLHVPMSSRHLRGCLILTWYLYKRSPLITKGYHYWQVSSFKPLLWKFEPNPFISLQVTVSETKAKLDKYYSDSALSYGIVQKWFTEFRLSRASTEAIPSLQVVQMRPLYQKFAKKSMILFWMTWKWKCVR